MAVEFNSPVELLEQVKELLNVRAQDKDIMLSVQHKLPLPRKILIDHLRFKQVLINLVGNAIKFTDEGGVSITLSIHNDLTRHTPDGGVDSSTLIIKIVDTGVGMTQQQVNRLFDAYYQADVQREGTGLGLVISKRLIELMGGTVKVHSELGKGSEFLIYLPIKFPLNQRDLWINSFNELNAELPKSHSNAKKDSPQLKGRVLLAEDTPDNQKLICMLLRRVGLEVEVAENGREAYEMASNNSYDLILMDMQMPVMSGAEATRLLRAQSYKGPIVALTANALVSEREAILQAGCDETLTKPIDLEVFYTSIDRILDQNSPVGTMTDDSDDEFALLQAEFRQNLLEYRIEGLKMLDEESWDELSQLAHKIKGMGGSFGYPNVTEAAHETEKFISIKDIASTRVSIEAWEA